MAAVVLACLSFSACCLTAPQNDPAAIPYKAGQRLRAPRFRAKLRRFMETASLPYKKKILLVALGTAGDVFPLLGLGRALQERGHQVQVASTIQYKMAIERGGLGFLPLHGIPGATDHPDYYHSSRSMHVVSEHLLIP